MPRVTITRCDCPLDTLHTREPWVVALDWGRIVDHHPTIEAAYQAVRREGWKLIIGPTRPEPVETADNPEPWSKVQSAALLSTRTNHEEHTS